MICLPETTATLDRVLLSFPTPVNVATAADTDVPAQSWIELAVVGDVVSNKYGKFSITTDDLARKWCGTSQRIERRSTMTTLTNSPTHPGDGIAAGWLQRVS